MKITCKNGHVRTAPILLPWDTIRIPGVCPVCMIGGHNNKKSTRTPGK